MNKHGPLNQVRKKLVRTLRNVFSEIRDIYSWLFVVVLESNISSSTAVRNYVFKKKPS